MERPQLLPVGDGLELTQMEMGDGQLCLHVRATSRTSICPLCGQPATRLHSRYSRVVKDLPRAGQQVQLILHVRKFFCDTAACANLATDGGPPSNVMNPGGDGAPRKLPYTPEAVSHS
jgi:hypothetical protein